VDLEALQQSIVSAINQELGTARLIPGTKPGIEYREEDLPTTISEMASFELIPHLSYRFSYFTYRYMLIAFLVERGSDYESGQIEIISTAPDKDPEIEEFSPPTIYVKKITNQVTGEGGVGVEFGVAYDSELSEGGQHQFGITYKITKTSTSVPKIRAFLLGVLSTTEA